MHLVWEEVQVLEKGKSRMRILIIHFKIVSLWCKKDWFKDFSCNRYSRYDAERHNTGPEPPAWWKWMKTLNLKAAGKHVALPSTWEPLRLSRQCTLHFTHYPFRYHPPFQSPVVLRTSLNKPHKEGLRCSEEWDLVSNPCIVSRQDLAQCLFLVLAILSSPLLFWNLQSCYLTQEPDDRNKKTEMGR